MKQPQKIYTPVTDFERATSYCPLYLAWRITITTNASGRIPFTRVPGVISSRRAMP
jgi:hypothetical protein